MGEYFLMSKRFNKVKEADFGLISLETNAAIDPKDDSVWVRHSLYDFGWGRENGFIKLPFPDFNLLWKLALYSTDEDDMYGATALILEKHPDELLYQIEHIVNNCVNTNEFKKIVNLFNLRIPVNRSSIIGKTHQQIQNDFLRWENVTKIAREFK